MIRTEEAYQLSRKYLSKLQQLLANEEQLLRAEGLPEDQVKNALDPMRSFTLGIQEELETYEKIQRGDPGLFPPNLLFKNDQLVK